MGHAQGDSVQPTGQGVTPPKLRRARGQDEEARLESVLRVLLVTEYPLLSIRELQSGYGDVTVLWNIDLDVSEGEIACIVGSNGAGKTTLLRTISGVVRASAGAITFAGRDTTYFQVLLPGMQDDRLYLVGEDGRVFAIKHP